MRRKYKMAFSHILFFFFKFVLFVLFSDFPLVFCILCFPLLFIRLLLVMLLLPTQTLGVDEPSSQLALAGLTILLSTPLLIPTY